MRLSGRSDGRFPLRLGRRRLQRALDWSALLLLVWAAGGLLIDLLRAAALLAPGLMPGGVDWVGLAARALTLAATVVLARLALEREADPAGETGAANDLSPTPARTRVWYAYLAFALALPYPVVKTWWALGATLGLLWPGAAGHVSDGDALTRFGLWLPAVPWLMAAALSLLLASQWRRLPHRLLVFAGWSATALVATFGPAAVLSLVNTLITGGDVGGEEGIATWVFALFYGSWALWALAAGAATRAYQLRSAALPRSALKQA